MMKKVVLFILAVSLYTTTHANFAKPTPKEKKELRSKIVKLLGETKFKFSKNVNLNVDLLVNKKGELIVLDIDSKNETIKSYVINKLNYKKVTKSLNNEVKLYKMPLKLLVK